MNISTHIEDNQIKGPDIALDGFEKIRGLLLIACIRRKLIGDPARGGNLIDQACQFIAIAPRQTNHKSALCKTPRNGGANIIARAHDQNNRRRHKDEAV